MKTAYKFLSLILGILTVAVGFSIGITNIKFIGNPFLLKATSADLTNQVVSFNRKTSTYSEDTTKKIFTSVSQTPSGNPVYLICEGGSLPANNAIAAVPPSSDSSLKDPVIKFYMDSIKTNPFKHQTIESVSITTSATITMSIQTSSDGVNFSEKGTLSCGSTAATLTGFDKYDRYIMITNSNKAAAARNIRDITICYSCSKNVVPSFTPGTYLARIKNNASAYVDVDIVFNNNGTGDFNYTNSNTGLAYVTKFTWAYSEITDSIKLTYATGGTGDNTAYQGCRLFYKFSSSVTDGSNTNYMGVVGDELVFFFYSSSTASSRWSNPTMFTRG